MKKQHLYLLALLVLVIGFAGTLKNEAQKKISFLGIPRYSVSVGYGNVYSCKLTKNPHRQLTGDSISLVFLAGDTLEKHLKEKQEQIFTFQKERENALYNMNAVTGFTDHKRTVWKLISIKR